VKWRRAGWLSRLLTAFLLIFALSLSGVLPPISFPPVKAYEECLKIYYDSENDCYYFLALNGERVVLEKSGFAVLNRWDGEAWINFGSFPSEGEIEIEVEAELVENKLKWKGKWKFGEEEVEVEIELEPKNISEYGDLEWSMKLTDKPPINVFSMPIQSENLKFYYQPPLYEEYGFSEPFSNSTFFVNATHVMEFNGTDWITTTYRPENVVGSYAVYHATKTPFHKSKEEAEKYRAGKAFHIYRPKLIDAEGKTAWADLNIDEKRGVLTITLPQDFLDKAVYPVAIDPTFGYETVGGTRTGTWNWIRGLLASPSENGNAQSITWYAEYAATGYNEACALYLDSDKTKIEDTEELDVQLTGWQTFNLLSNPAIEAGVYYILAFQSQYAYAYYDSVTDSGYTYGQDYTYPFPETFGSDTLHDYKWSIYCTYTAGAPGDTTPPTYSNVGTNTTQAGQPCLFHCLWTDDTELSGYIFSWNASGNWQNDTWTSLSGAEAWANVTKTLPSSHVVVGYRWYCNDTSNNWNSTSISTIGVVVSLEVSEQLTVSTTLVFNTESQFLESLNYQAFLILSTSHQTDYTSTANLPLSIILTESSAWDSLIPLSYNLIPIFTAETEIGYHLTLPFEIFIQLVTGTETNYHLALPFELPIQLTTAIQTAFTTLLSFQMTPTLSLEASLVALQYFVDLMLTVPVQSSLNIATSFLNTFNLNVPVNLVETSSWNSCVSTTLQTPINLLITIAQGTMKTVTSILEIAIDLVTSFTLSQWSPPTPGPTPIPIPQPTPTPQPQPTIPTYALVGVFIIAGIIIGATIYGSLPRKPKISTERKLWSSRKLKKLLLPKWIRKKGVKLTQKVESSLKLPTWRKSKSKLPKRKRKRKGKKAKMKKKKIWD